MKHRRENKTEREKYCHRIHKKNEKQSIKYKVRNIQRFDLGHQNLIYVHLYK